MLFMTSFKDLIVWQKSVELSVLIFALTKQIPKEELYGITSQMRRSAVSIPSNIAEGQRRNNTREYYQFCGVALGSAAELETQIIIINKVYPTINCDQVMRLCIEIQKMLTSLVAKLRS